MKKTICIISLVIFLIFLLSCNGSKIKNDNNKRIKLEINDSITIRSDILKVIEDCIKKYPQYDKFLILSKIPVYTEKCCSNYFLIGPAFQQSPKDKMPILSFMLNGKKIFFSSQIDLLYKRNHHQDSIYRSNLIKDGEDSIREYDGWAKNSCVMYLYRSTFVEILSEDKLLINYRPDTLILPRRGPTTIIFKPY